MDYILFGIQGSGKGTQGKILAEKKSAAYFETGEELRRLAKKNSTLGKKVKTIIKKGHLVPTEVVMEIVEEFVKRISKPKSVIFDGIPRNKEQSDLLIMLLKKLHRLYMGIYFELSRKEAEKRLLKRRSCTKCKMVYPALFHREMCKCGGSLEIRADDNIESIRTRLDIFYKETLAVIEDWKTRGKIITVNGMGSIEEVTKELLLGARVAPSKPAKPDLEPPPLASCARYKRNEPRG